MTDFNLPGLLNNPLLQLGTNLLQAGGPTPGHTNFGQSVGRAFDTTRGQLQSQAQMDLRGELIRAQIAELQRPAAVKAPGITADVGGFKRFTTGPQAGQRVFPGVQAPEAGVSAFDEKVSALESTGIPRDIAIGIQAGRFATTRDPITGVAQVIDKATSRIIFDGSQVTPEPIPTPVPSPAPTVPDVSQALGAGGVARSVVNKVADLFGGDLPFQEASEASAQLSNLNNEAIQLLRAGLGGRPNVQLQKRIEKLLVEPNEIFGGEQEAKNKFKAIIDTIDTETRRLETELQSGRLRPTTADEARSKISELRTLSGKFNSILASQQPQNKGDINRFFR